MSAPCVACIKATTTPHNILLICNQCERPWHHRCHRPVVTDNELLQIIHLFKSRPPDAPGPKRLEWTCKACNTKGKPAKVASGSAEPGHKRVELASGSGSRLAPIELKPAQPNIIAPIKKPPTPIVVDDDSEDDIVILEKLPQVPIGSRSVQLCKSPIPLSSQVPHPRASIVSKPADNATSKPGGGSSLAVPLLPTSSSTANGGSSSRPPANAPHIIHGDARPPTKPKIVQSKTIPAVSVMHPPTLSDPHTNSQHAGPPPKPIATKIVKKTIQKSAAQRQIKQVLTTHPHQAVKSANLSLAAKGTQRITTQPDPLFLKSDSSDDDGTSLSPSLSKPVHKHKPIRKPQLSRLSSAASSVTAALNNDFVGLSVKTPQLGFDGGTDDDVDMLADDTGSEYNVMKVKVEPTTSFLPSAARARRNMLIPGWIETRHVADNAVPDMWDRSAARKSTNGLVGRRGRKDFRVIHMPSVVGGQAADNGKGKGKQRADAPIIKTTRELRHISEAPFVFNVDVWKRGKTVVHDLDN